MFFFSFSHSHICAFVNGVFPHCFRPKCSLISWFSVYPLLPNRLIDLSGSFKLPSGFFSPLNVGISIFFVPPPHSLLSPFSLFSVDLFFLVQCPFFLDLTPHSHAASAFSPFIPLCVLFLPLCGLLCRHLGPPRSCTFRPLLPTILRSVCLVDFLDSVFFLPSSSFSLPYVRDKDCQN